MRDFGKFLSLQMIEFEAFPLSIGQEGPIFFARCRVLPNCPMIEKSIFLKTGRLLRITRSSMTCGCDIPFAYRDTGPHRGGAPGAVHEEGGNLQDFGTHE